MQKKSVASFTKGKKNMIIFLQSKLKFLLKLFDVSVDFLLAEVVNGESKDGFQALQTGKKSHEVTVVEVEDLPLVGENDLQDGLQEPKIGENKLQVVAAIDPPTVYFKDFMVSILRAGIPTLGLFIGHIIGRTLGILYYFEIRR